MKKRLMALLLCVVMATTMLAACGGGEGAKDVTVFWYDEADVYLGTVREALNKELEAAGLSHDNQYAGAAQNTQLDQIRTAVAGGTKLLIVNMVSSGAEETAKEIISIAGDIPVIFFNRAIGTNGSDNAILDEYANVCFIGTDAPEAGHMQGKMIGEYVVANFDTIDLNKDGKISYAMMKGEEGNVEAEYRTQYGVEDANAVLKAAGKPELVYFDSEAKVQYQVDQGGKWSAAAATDYMTTNLVSFNSDLGNMIELVICNNDGMAEGVVATLQANQFNKEGCPVIPVFGVDATKNAIDLIAKGAMTGTVKQDAEGMAAAIAQTAKAMFDGKGSVDALAALTDERFSVAKDCKSKLYVAYAPYTGK